MSGNAIIGRMVSARELVCDCESPCASDCGLLVDMGRVGNTRTVVVQAPGTGRFYGNCGHPVSPIITSARERSGVEHWKRSPRGDERSDECQEIQFGHIDGETILVPGERVAMSSIEGRCVSKLIMASCPVQTTR